MKSNQTERQLRLECLKIAANVVCQLKDPKTSVVSLAKAYYVFLDEMKSEDEAQDNSVSQIRRAS